MNHSRTSVSQCWRTIQLAALLLASLMQPREAVSQSITLPTLRTYDVDPEGLMLYRVVARVQNLYGRDTLPAAQNDAQRISAAKQVISRSNRMLLAALTDDQLDQLSRPGSDERRALIIIAGRHSLWDDAGPIATLQALREVGRDGTGCTSTSEHAKAAAESKSTKRFALFSVPQDSQPASRSVQCVIEEMRERTPRLLIAAQVRTERGAGRPEHAAALDTLARVATAVVIRRKLSKRYGFASLLSRAQAEAFWRQRGVSPLNVGSISGSTKSGAAFTEIASPLLHMVRVSVNAVLVTEADAAEVGPTTPSADVHGPAGTLSGARRADDAAPAGAVQRLLNGGGLLNVNFAWPAFYQGTENGSVDAMVLLAPRFGLTSPVLNASASDSTTLSMDLGAELHLKAADLVDGVGLIAQARLGYAFGSRNVGDALGIPGARSVSYAACTFGFIFARQYMLTAGKAFGGPSAVTKSPWQVGLTVFKLPSGG